MNTAKGAFKNSRGSALIAVMIFAVVMSAALGGLLTYTSNTHRNSTRLAITEQARLVAESEMEYLFYAWNNGALDGYTGDDLRNALVAAGYIANNVDPFSATIKAQGLALAPIAPPATTGGWRIDRFMKFERLPPRADGGASGKVPGSQKVGRNFYYEARIRASMNHPVFGAIEYKAARRFVQTETSLFQNAIYYQDDLEVAALGTLVVNGDISCNGNAYLAAQGADNSGGNDLVIYGTARIFGTLNGATIDGSGAIGTLKRKPGAAGTSALHDPIFDPTSGISPPSDQVATRATQVEKLTLPEDVLGGVNVATAMVNYADAYKQYDNLAYDPITNPAVANEVYRSVIAPPQRALITGVVIPEDPVISSRRMYNRAGIVVTLSANTTSPGLTDVHVGTGANSTLYDITMLADMQYVIPDASTSATAINERRQILADQREDRDVNVTNFYVDRLIAKIASNAAIAAAYNGVIYIHDTSLNNIDPVRNAIRIKNATATPVINDPLTGLPKGFTIVSNNGIYIQGDFNTTAITTGHYNPCAIMGDAITVLSPGFVDSYRATSATVLNRDASANIVINSALISGNTPSGTGTTSGGVQNLVRYLEDWSGPGRSATFHGSLSQLFTSKYFFGIYQPNGAAGNVYTNPTPRVFEFDTDLADNPPALSPRNSYYFRGDFYTW